MRENVLKQKEIVSLHLSGARSGTFQRVCELSVFACLACHKTTDGQCQHREAFIKGFPAGRVDQWGRPPLAGGIREYEAVSLHGALWQGAGGE